MLIKLLPVLSTSLLVLVAGCKTGGTFQEENSEVTATYNRDVAAKIGFYTSEKDIKDIEWPIWWSDEEAVAQKYYHLRRDLRVEVLVKKDSEQSYYEKATFKNMIIPFEAPSLPDEYRHKWKYVKVTKLGVCDFDLYVRRLIPQRNGEVEEQVFKTSIMAYFEYGFPQQDQRIDPATGRHPEVYMKTYRIGKQVDCKTLHAISRANSKVNPFDLRRLPLK